MLSVEEAQLDAITAALHQLRTGKLPSQVPIPASLPDNELRQLITYLNRFLTEFVPFAEALERVSRGDLETGNVLGRMGVVQSLKALTSNLKHLTYKTQQIAGGDLGQRVDFMGEFSTAFNQMTQQLKDSYQELERRNEFIRKVFGRYTSNEVVEALLDAPDGLKLGGEKRQVTILMSDLRGFTALAERLEATEVVSLLNHYLSAMVEVIQRNGGTIDEIIGDAILVLFGAPVVTADDAGRAIVCALEMQRAMEEVNRENGRRGWPEIEMGIALHTGEVVVGNIGSEKRSKYGVVGRTINTTARIESFTVGGQVIVSPTAMAAAGAGLVLGDEVEVLAKGMKEPLHCRQLLGHADHPGLDIQTAAGCTALPDPVPVQFVTLTGKHFDEKMEAAKFVALSRRQAVLETGSTVPLYSNLLVRLEAVNGESGEPELYAKVIRCVVESSNRYLIQFTSVPPEVLKRLNRLAGNDRPQV